mmetsp:Transcript_58033/g.126037  ORF Transcript_58033/g.126037 Transcript_58033/m.126037 type:complete len:260 (-) Transcript_58033:684-1463(-)
MAAAAALQRRRLSRRRLAVCQRQLAARVVDAGHRTLPHGGGRGRLNLQREAAHVGERAARLWARAAEAVRRARRAVQVALALRRHGFGGRLKAQAGGVARPRALGRVAAMALVRVLFTRARQIGLGQALPTISSTQRPSRGWGGPRPAQGAFRHVRTADALRCCQGQACRRRVRRRRGRRRVRGRRCDHTALSVSQGGARALVRRRREAQRGEGVHVPLCRMADCTVGMQPLALGRCAAAASIRQATCRRRLQADSARA